MAVNSKIRKSLRNLVDSGILESYPPPFLLAVSGGPDSQCLLKAFTHVASGFGFKCVAAGVNHGLRKEADSELDLAMNLAKEVGIPFHRVRVSVNGYSNVQNAARNARYDALRKVADENGCGLIVTAHHFDDRAETVLMRLLTTRKISMIGVMPLVCGRIYRPMLDVRKQEIMNYLNYWKIPFAMDPSNEDTKYLRVKIRKKILPMLEEVNPRIKDSLNHLADSTIMLFPRLHYDQ